MLGSVLLPKFWMISVKQLSLVTVWICIIYMAVTMMMEFLYGLQIENKAELLEK